MKQPCKPQPTTTPSDIKSVAKNYRENGIVGFGCAEDGVMDLDSGIR